MGAHTRIDYIANDPVWAKEEIVLLRNREQLLKRDVRRKEMEKELDSNDYHISGKQLGRTYQAVQITDNTVINPGLNNQQQELWGIRRNWPNKNHKNDSNGKKKKKKVKVHPVLTRWDIVFLGRTSGSVYKEAKQVM